MVVALSIPVGPLHEGLHWLVIYFQARSLLHARVANRIWERGSRLQHLAWQDRRLWVPRLPKPVVLGALGVHAIARISRYLIELKVRLGIKRVLVVL
jgi:hypothetical protein